MIFDYKAVAPAGFCWDHSNSEPQPDRYICHTMKASLGGQEARMTLK